ncbi:MAG TPA: hypothetical protein VMV92_09640 [Streptosporangiaceae bacterium]|nr:hypothetical protein [Streptosporangiaceae bacterium]
MSRMIRVELLKIRTARLVYGLLATAIGLTLLFSVLEAARSGPGKAVPPLNTGAGVTAILTGGTWALLLATVMGATVSSGEFRHSTATLTYLANPHRSQVLTAKAVAAAIVGAVFGLAGFVLPAIVAVAFASGHGYTLQVTAATLARYGAGHVLGGALLATIGVGLGSLIRSQLAVVIGVFVWTIVIESLIGALFNSVQPWLPYTAATTLAGSQLGGAAFGPAHGVASTVTSLPFAGSTALLAGLAVVIALLASQTTVTRDIS